MRSGWEEPALGKVGPAGLRKTPPHRSCRRSPLSALLWQRGERDRECVGLDQMLISPLSLADARCQNAPQACSWATRSELALGDRRDRLQFLRQCFPLQMGAPWISSRSGLGLPWFARPAFSLLVESPSAFWPPSGSKLAPADLQSSLSGEHTLKWFAPRVTWLSGVETRPCQLFPVSTFHLRQTNLFELLARIASAPPTARPGLV